MPERSCVLGVGHIGHKLNGIQWGHWRHEIVATPMGTSGTCRRWTSVTKCVRKNSESLECGKESGVKISQ
jgi:hypothetical protein